MRTLIILSCLLLSGCLQSGNNRASETMAIRKGAPAVYIHPMSDSYRQGKVGVLPLQVPANIKTEQGKAVAALFRDVLLGRRAFQTVQLLEQPYGTLEEAVEIGRRAEVDLVLAGKINYAIEGTELGGARVEVAIRLINVTSGNTVWFISQGLDQEMDYPDVSLSNRLLSSFSPPKIRRSAGAPVATNMLVRIAEDMTSVMAGARYVAP